MINLKEEMNTIMRTFLFFTWSTKKNLKIIKRGYERNHENAQHQILARATKFLTGLCLLFMYVKYDFQRKNNITLDQILAPNLNV